MEYLMCYLQITQTQNNSITYLRFIFSTFLAKYRIADQIYSQHNNQFHLSLLKYFEYIINLEICHSYL